MTPDLHGKPASCAEQIAAVPERGKHRKRETVPYFQCLGCRAVVAFDVDSLRGLMPGAFAFFDIGGPGSIDPDWLPEQLLTEAEAAVEQHELEIHGVAS